MRVFRRMLVVAALAALVETTTRRAPPRAEVPAPRNAVNRVEIPAVCVAYPHALAKCGVKSPEEFEALRGDRYLERHYSEVGVVRPAVLKADEWDYASYRGVGGIVWTPRRILVRAGELVFRDRFGHTVRARCGNRLSQEPQIPAAAEMAPEMEHEAPQIELVENKPPELWADKPVDLLVPPLPSLTNLLEPPGTPAQPPQDPPLDSMMPADTLQALARASGFTSIAPPIHATPEPSTLLLFSGAALLLWWRRRIRS